MNPIVGCCLWAIMNLSGVSEAGHATDAPSAVEVRRATQEVVRDVARSVRPYLVRIETVGGTQPRAGGSRVEAADDPDADPATRRRTQRPFEDTPGSDFALADGPTTGVIYSADGYIVTSSFNFVREPALVSVTLADGRRLAADVVARDQVRKLALLKVDATNLPTPEWAPLETVRVGQWAIALGLGFGGDEASVTVGIVSALNRMRGNAVQTDAKLSPANYGGPLCDVYGRIVGLCVPMAQRPGELAGIEMYDAGVGFAVPSPRVREILETLKDGKSFYRGWLGISVDPRSQDAVVIRNIADPSPMRRAGVQPGDRLLGAEGRPIKHFGQLVQTLYMLPAGQEVYLHLDHRGVEYGVAVTLARSADLGDLPDVPEPFDPSNPFPGMQKPKDEELPKSLP